MREKKFFETKIGDKTLNVQIGGLADQASGHCLVRQGDTSALITAQLGEERTNLSFFPLTCDYEERFYAAGKIMGSRFVRREGRPTSNAVLTARMIDRAIRPLFPKNFKKEVQCITTCLSWDGDNDPAVLGLFGSSLALGLSEIPWEGPIGAVRVARVEGRFILQPTYEEREKGDLDVVFAAIEQNGKVLINMIEAKANEIPEETFSEAFKFAEPFLKGLIDFQKEIVKAQGKEKIFCSKEQSEPNLEKAIQKFLTENLEPILFQKDRRKSKEGIKDLEKQLYEMIKQEFGEDNIEAAKNIFEIEKEKIIDDNILAKEKRVDGRGLEDTREISCEVGVLPRTHGSCLFTRGETRILSILTLGAPGDQQLLEGMEISGKKRFLHHYNFPPYSVGEVNRLGSPGRREIGHGMLVERALLPLIPSFDEFPYTIRIVSEAISSNGSTSMASVSAASLALMDAGVPIKEPAAGISIGMVKKSEKDYKLLTDIQGPEDSSGDMDFKVAGTKNGIMVVQMDVKVDGIEEEILKEALQRAKKARLDILDIMASVLKSPRPKLSPYAPKIYTLQINPEKIGLVIGPGGKVINEIIDECEVSVDIEDSGRVFITAEKEESAQKAIDWIKGLTREFKIGEVFQGKVRRILDFGAMIEIAPGQEGLVHISEFVPYRLNKVQDLVKIGDLIPVKIISIDNQGRINLSAKEAGFIPSSKGRPLS